MPLTTIFDEVMDGPGRADPFPVYRRWREHDPVQPVIPGHWALTRYADVSAVLRDLRFGVMPAPRLPIPIFKTLFRMIKFVDPPDHRRLRQPVAGAFTPRAVEELRAFVDSTCAALLDGRTSIDVAADYAALLPIHVEARLLGVSDRRRDKVGGWARTVMQGTDTPTPRDLADVWRLWRVGDLPSLRTLDAAAKLRRFARRLLRGRVRDEVPSAAVTALRAAVADGSVALDDAAATYMALMLGGVAALRAVLANGVYTLLAHPDQLARLRAEPSLIPQAVEELARFDGPGVQVQRRALEDVELGGVVIKAGDIVHLMLGAANRDPDAFDDPDRLDVARRPAVRHLDFGTGIHHCPGDHLSRMVLEAALAALLPRLPDGLPDGFQPEWKRSISVREIRSLPLTLRPA